MKNWRVGTLSMGVTLVVTGIALALSMFAGHKAYDTLLLAAPLVLVLLGVELLVYLKLAGSERTNVRYDWISLFLVAAIGIYSLGLSMFGSLGLLDEIRREVRAAEHTITLEPERHAVPESVKRIVVNGRGHVKIDRTADREMHLMGQIRYWSPEPKNIANGGALLKTNQVGSTLYVWIEGVSRDRDWFRPSPDHLLTLVVPEQIEVETRGY